MAPLAIAVSAVAPAALAARASSSRRLTGRVNGLGLGLRRASAPVVGRRSLPVAALPEKEKTLTREDEPEDFWVSEAEAEGKNPFKVPPRSLSLPSIRLVSLCSPTPPTPAPHAPLPPSRSYLP